MDTHALSPFADRIGDHYRIYFSGRDRLKRGRIGYFVMDPANPGKISQISNEPVVDLGSLGAFDDHGITGSCLVNHNGAKYLYYNGWNLGVTVPFYIHVGLAVSEDNGSTFHKVSPAPILGRNEVDPYMTASAWVIIEGHLWRMWYGSCSKWEIQHDQPKHYYHIRYAESADGIHWKREGIVCIDYQSPDEHAIARPCVVKIDGVYKMWYAYRGQSYRIGYAESADGISWTRQDENSGIDVSESGWDSEMIEYPYVFEHEGAHYMLYNGNAYGKTGIGLAVLDGGC